MPRQTRVRRSILAPLLILAALSAGPAAAQALNEARALKVGQFLWDEGSVGDAGALSISVNIAEQRIYVYRAGQLIGMSTVSTGSKGHSTPVGDFTILQKHMWHRSNLYSNAPMPFMQRLTWTGIAIHAGHLPGYAASHGCIRLPAAFAKRLFGITTLGVPVTIVGANRRPLVKLQFADIEWLSGDDDVLARPDAQLFVRPAAARESYLIEERTQPIPVPHAGPHWLNAQEIEAVRTGREQPRLEFEALPQ